MTQTLTCRSTTVTPRVVVACQRPLCRSCQSRRHRRRQRRNRKRKPPKLHRSLKWRHLSQVRQGRVALCCGVSVKTVTCVPHSLSSFLLRPVPYLGSAHQVFNLHILRSCASSIVTPFSFMSFLITSLHLSFGLHIFRCPPTSIFHVCPHLTPMIK